MLKGYCWSEHFRFVKARRKSNVKKCVLILKRDGLYLSLTSNARAPAPFSRPDGETIMKQFGRIMPTGISLRDKVYCSSPLPYRAVEPVMLARLLP